MWLRIAGWAFPALPGLPICPAGSYGSGMPRFIHDGVEIAFIDEGAGEPIALVHGVASNKEVNWIAPSWVTTLSRAGRRVIALDNRGHGASSKLYDPAAYHSAIMAEDVRALLDDRGCARGAVACRCCRSDRLHVPRLCRADQIRFARARSLHARFAPNAKP